MLLRAGNLQVQCAECLVNLFRELVALLIFHDLQFDDFRFLDQLICLLDPLAVADDRVVFASFVLYRVADRPVDTHNQLPHGLDLVAEFQRRLDKPLFVASDGLGLAEVVSVHVVLVFALHVLLVLVDLAEAHEEMRNVLLFVRSERNNYVLRGEQTECIRTVLD